MPYSTSTQKKWEIIFLAKHTHGPKWPAYTIAAYLHCSISVVRKWIQRYEETGDVEELEHTGRPSIVNSKTDKQLVDLLEKQPELSSKTLSVSLKRKGVDISDRTVRRRLKAVGLTYGSNLSKPLLTGTHCAKRLAWAEENINRDWKVVLFTDESTFNINMKRKKV
jgi:transposase